MPQKITLPISNFTIDKCGWCGHGLFEMRIKIVVLSALIPGNHTGKELSAPLQCLICSGCGKERNPATEISIDVPTREEVAVMVKREKRAEMNLRHSIN